MSRAVTLDELVRHLNRMSQGSLMDKVEILALKVAADAETSAKNTASSVLKPRTGHLAQSIRATPVRTDDGIAIELAAGGGSNNVKYAKVHEQDGVPGTFFTIQPKSATYLRFPVSDDAFTPAGVARGGGAGSRWVMTKEVRIPARPFLRPAFETMAQRFRGAVGRVVTAEVVI
jgi:phage gpG-like protein